MEWKRVFTAPNLAVDSSAGINPFSQEDFKRYTENKRGTVGDLWDAAGELSEKRKQKAGKDPVLEKKFQDFEKQTGKKHHVKKQQEATERLKKKGVTLVGD